MQILSFSAEAWQDLVRQQQRGDGVHQDGEYQEQEVEHSLQQDTELPRLQIEVTRSLLTRQIRSITKLELRSRWRALLRRTWMLARLPAHHGSVCRASKDFTNTDKAPTVVKSSTIFVWSSFRGQHSRPGLLRASSLQMFLVLSPKTWWSYYVAGLLQLLCVCGRYRHTENKH